MKFKKNQYNPRLDICFSTASIFSANVKSMYESARPLNTVVNRMH
jgi:DNA-binding XRE family transcriptional regulator